MITSLVSSSGYGVDEFTQEELREIVYSGEEWLRDRPQVELPVEHYFADGLYMRKILIPKGVALTGRIHKQNDLQILFYGDIEILTEHGLKRFTGNASFTSKAGVKPFALAHEDTLWATVHHTHLTDLDEIERELFSQDESPEFDFATGKVIQEVLVCQPQ
jgi:hypothetical protein